MAPAREPALQADADTLASVTIEPDTKDWTWVLQRQCPECGLHAGTVPVASVPEIVRLNAASWQQVLARPNATERPTPRVWSPLEYGCHVRDVLALFDMRVGLMLGSDDPLFDNWDQDATAVAERYGEQDPAAVAAQLLANAEVLAATFEGVSGEQWNRTGRRTDGATFTVETIARYCIHDLVHHVHDVSPTLTPR